MTEKVLYCVAYEVYKNNGWVAREKYMHAEDRLDAMKTWAAGVPQKLKVGFNVRIVGVAPVVGIHMENDKTGVCYV